MKLILKVIFKAIKILITALMSPINLVVQNFFPDVTDTIVQANLFFSNITNGILWVKSWLPFTTGFYTMLVAVLVFKLSVPLAVHGLKLVLKWYYMLKP